MKLLTLVAVLFLTGCSGQSIDDYKSHSDTFDVQSFFNGPLKAHGVVLNHAGVVQRRFSVKMQGTWSDNEGKLEEWFIFDDGEKTTRTWIINKLGNGQYSGTAQDIHGQAVGEAAGFALHWDYQLDIKVEESSYRVTFDDWLYQVSSDTVINRSYIKKWGINVGEVILVINKE